jgi:hypothetical protein
MDGTLGTYGGEGLTGFWWVGLMERDHLEDLGVDGRVILILVFKKWDGA